RRGAGGPFATAAVAAGVRPEAEGALVGQGVVVGGGLLLENGDARLHFGWLDVGDEAPLEPAAQPLLEALDLGGKLVRGDEDLLATLVQGVEGVEELLHRLLLVAEELDVVQQQDVALLAVARAELG